MWRHFAVTFFAFSLLFVTGAEAAPVLEDFEAVPTWSSTEPTTLVATYAADPGGVSGNALAISYDGTTTGDDYAVLAYPANPDTTYVVSIKMSVPATTATFWAEVSAQTGSATPTAAEYAAGWGGTLVRRFDSADAGYPDQTGGLFNEMTALVSTGPSDTVLAIGINVGRAASTGGVDIYFDELVIMDVNDSGNVQFDTLDVPPAYNNDNFLRSNGTDPDQQGVGDPDWYVTRVSWNGGQHWTLGPDASDSVAGEAMSATSEAWAAYFDMYLAREFFVIQPGWAAVTFWAKTNDADGHLQFDLRDGDLASQDGTPGISQTDAMDIENFGGQPRPDTQYQPNPEEYGDEAWHQYTQVVNVTGNSATLILLVRHADSFPGAARVWVDEVVFYSQGDISSAPHWHTYR